MLTILSILRSRLLWQAMLLALAGVIIWQFWDSLFQTFGMGIVLLLALVIAIALVIRYRRFSLFQRYWNYWLGAIVFSLAIIGLLGFFVPVAGPLEDVSLGGKLGTEIIGSANIGGAIRLIGLCLIGMSLVAPSFSKRSALSLGRTISSWAQRLPDLWRRLAEWWSDFYAHHPIHRDIADWFRRRRSLAPGTDEPPPIPVPVEFTEAGHMEQDLQPIPVQAVDIGSPFPSEESVPVLLDEAAISDSTDPESSEIEGLEITFSGIETGLPVAPTPQATRSSGQWQLPCVDILEELEAAELSQPEVQRRAEMLEKALASYGVDAKVVEVNVGPAVTQFGIEPGWDRKFKDVREKDEEGNIKITPKEISKTRVKVERITSLSNDLALAMATPGVRVEAPVPGKSLVGIEVPNRATSTVTLREAVDSPPFQKLSSRTKLAVALGKGTSGDMVAADLAKMPHLLIAGATGSGKSVCLDAVIYSLLMNNTPDELHLLLIDPKRVELVSFAGLPHLAAPVIVDADKAVEALKWVCAEMDARYRRLSKIGANSIMTYNKKVPSEKPMPFLVVVIDELADLMMAKTTEIEPLVCRVAQLGRATGIHEVLATQRPSVDVITGLIKANFPTRISFAVVSQTDSRTILDTGGAEKLLGRGDMLYLAQDAAKPARIQGCFVSDTEIHKVVEHWTGQLGTKKWGPPALAPLEEDPLLEQARQLTRDHKHVSISFLQRQLRIGNIRAQQLSDILQKERESQPEVSTDIEYAEDIEDTVDDY